MSVGPQIFDPLTLPCGTVLQNRIVKAAMSDVLGDGTGHPTIEQGALYRRWAKGSVAVSLIGEVQGESGFAECPGNLVLTEASDIGRFEQLASSVDGTGSQLWMQLGHAGALAYEETSTRKGPSALDLPDLHCAELSLAEIEALPGRYGRTARLAKASGFGGVQIHAGHGYLLSQFLSPLFNKRLDAFGGSVANRARLLLQAITEARAAVGPDFPVAVKLNATDQLEGGFSEEDALEVITMLDRAGVDLIDISGGTYFPGARSASGSASSGGPYFLDFARQARHRTDIPLMLTGGFKTFDQAESAVAEGVIDVVGLARALVLEPSLPNLWLAGQRIAPAFPKFASTIEGGITAWYTMRIAALGGLIQETEVNDPAEAIAALNARETEQTATWLKYFAS
ncbi:MAG: oxidoreductase [Pseudomonadota bacterium]